MRCIYVGWNTSGDILTLSLNDGETRQGTTAELVAHHAPRSKRQQRRHSIISPPHPCHRSSASGWEWCRKRRQAYRSDDCINIGLETCHPA